MTSAHINNAFVSAETLIQLQANANAQIVSLSIILSQRPGVKSIVRMCEVRRYQAKTIFEICVDVETHRGKSYSFWFEIGCENNMWHVEASISQTLRDGQGPLEEYSIASLRDENDLETAVTNGIEWLVERSTKFDF